MHVYRGGAWWEGNFVPCEQFDEMEIVSRMVDDHLLDSGYYPALLNYIRHLKKDWNWKFEHDTMDVHYIRETAQKR